MYTLLFGIPGLLLSAIITVMLLSTVLTILWLFVFGNDPWPAVDMLQPLAPILAFLLLWGASLWCGCQVGMRRETDARLHVTYMLASAGVAAALLAFVLLMLMVLRG